MAAEVLAVLAPEPVAPGRRGRPWALIIPAVVLGLLVLAAILGPLFTPDPDVTALRDAKLPMFSDGHLLGTDGFGRDLLSRTLHGARVSLVVGVSAVALCLLVGGLLGMLAGFRGGLIDTVIMRVMDMVLAFPSLVLAMTVAAFLGASIRNVVLAVAFSQVPEYARLSRAVSLSIRERDFVLSSTLMGGTPRHILRRHILPNVLPPLLAFGLLAVGIAVIAEASLSFLGLGVRPPTPSWGVMIAESRAHLQDAPHLALVPGTMLFLTILSLNLLADAIRARMDGSSAVGQG